MPSDKARLGRRAEILAAGELGRRGYRIVGSNFRCRFGEIDLIARDGEALVFVEVRSRSSTNYGFPSETVNSVKQRKILKSAQVYLAMKKLEDVPCRFDVVEVVFGSDGAKIEIIPDAFSSPN